MPYFQTQRQEETYRSIQAKAYAFARNDANGDVVLACESNPEWQVAVHPNGRFTEI